MHGPRGVGIMAGLDERKEGERSQPMTVFDMEKAMIRPI
jgi:hypothetical protein